MPDRTERRAVASAAELSLLGVTRSPRRGASAVITSSRDLEALIASSTPAANSPGTFATFGV